MKVDRITNDQGQMWVFDVCRTQASRMGLARTIAALSGVEISHWPCFNDDEVFCEFSYKGESFSIREAYGDSDRFTVHASLPDSVRLLEIALHVEASEPLKGGDTGQLIYKGALMVAFPLIVILIVKWVLGFIER